MTMLANVVLQVSVHLHAVRRLRTEHLSIADVCNPTV